jgi:spectinomycin phosphotransferase
VHTEPQDLDRASLAGALERHWSIAVRSIDYRPVGFGSHHWAADAVDGSRWFVSVDDLEAAHNAGRAPDDVFAALDRAFRTAAALRDDAGLEFVLAPIRSHDGSVLHRLGMRYAVRVEPFTDGTSAPSGEFTRLDERCQMGTLLGRLHAASGRVPAGLPGRENFELPARAALETALGRLDERWGHGPFAEPARALLRAHAGAVHDRLAAYERVAAVVGEQPDSWVVTHGEPHNANVLRDVNGGIQLVDWDTALIGPRERDLWMTLDASLTGWDEYRDVAGAVSLDEQAVALYRERWALAEICGYVAAFRRPHDDTEDMRESWEELGEYLP